MIPDSWSILYIKQYITIMIFFFWNCKTDQIWHAEKKYADLLSESTNENID